MCVCMYIYIYIYIYKGNIIQRKCSLLEFKTCFQTVIFHKYSKIFTTNQYVQIKKNKKYDIIT